MIPYSVLDLSPIPEGASVAEALHNTLDLARHAERWGYRRFWLAEHHGMPGIASSAPPVLLAHVATGDERARLAELIHARRDSLGHYEERAATFGREVPLVVLQRH